MNPGCFRKNPTMTKESSSDILKKPQQTTTLSHMCSLEFQTGYITLGGAVSHDLLIGELRKCRKEESTARRIRIWLDPYVQ